jgi:hypothetical protein
VQTDEA